MQCQKYNMAVHCEKVATVTNYDYNEKIGLVETVVVISILKILFKFLS
jgi:hypothetical protein